MVASGQALGIYKMNTTCIFFAALTIVLSYITFWHILVFDRFDVIL